MKTILLASSLLLFACNQETPKEVVETPQQNVLTPEEIQEGWILLFDGQTMDQWRIYKSDTLFGWEVKDGEMVALGTAGLEGLGSDIISKEQYENFELSLDWKVSAAGNSGIFFNVIESPDLTAVYQSGPEYQLIDDIGFPPPLEDWQKSGANYAMHPPSEVASNPAGEWNTSKIKVENGKVTHWLNGKTVVEYQLWTPEWEELIQKGKWKDVPAYGRATKGHIALQDHGNQTWFRNIKIKTL